MANRILTISLVFFMFSACQKDADLTKTKDALLLEQEDCDFEFPLNEVFEITYQSKKCNTPENISFQCDTLEDHRCPIGYQCFWEGFALIGLIYRSDTKEIRFEVTTSDYGMLNKEVTVDGYTVKIIGLTPHIIRSQSTPIEDYIAQIQVTKN